MKMHGSGSMIEFWELSLSNAHNITVAKKYKVMIFLPFFVVSFARGQCPASVHIIKPNVLREHCVSNRQKKRSRDALDWSYPLGLFTPIVSNNGNKKSPNRRFSTRRKWKKNYHRWNRSDFNKLSYQTSIKNIEKKASIPRWSFKKIDHRR